MKLKTRLYVATEKEDNYKLWDSFTKEEYVEIAIIAKEEFGLDTIVKLNTIKLSS